MNGQQEWGAFLPVQHHVSVTMPRLTAGNLRALLEAAAIPDDADVTLTPMDQREGSGWSVTASWSTS